MKKFLTLAVAATIGLASFSSCTKSSSAPSYYIKADITSGPYNSSTCNAVFKNGLLVIAALGGTNGVTYPYMTLSIQNWSGITGKIAFDGVNITGTYVTSSTGQSAAQTGTLTITNVTSAEIDGTYSFKCSDGADVTNGSFAARRM